MKKLLVLTLAVVMSLSLTGLALAQNVALVAQDGDRNDAVVGQSGGEFNLALVGQEGNANEASVEQSGVAGSLDTFALIDQFGDRNKAEVVQVAPAPTWTGQTHRALVLQSGNANEGFIAQSVTWDGALGVILQDGDRNFADIAQDGNQFGEDSFAVIAQFGNANEARQKQTSYGSPLIRALAVQMGDRNEIDQHQRHTAYADESLAVAFQLGNANYIKQYQGEIGDGSINRYGIAIQLGDRNEAEMRQVGEDVEHVAFSFQMGDANKSSQTQEFGQHLGAIIQLGDRNEATQKQTDGMNLGAIVQMGNANTAAQTQGAGLGLGVIVQAGDRNEATQTQSGGLSLAATLQTGNANTSTVTQIGN